MAQAVRVNGKAALISGGPSFESTMGAIQKARKDYLFGTDEPVQGQKVRDVFRRNACSETIERCENFINSNKANEQAIDVATHMGMIKIATSGHRYIQLG